MTGFRLLNHTLVTLTELFLMAWPPAVSCCNSVSYCNGSSPQTGWGWADVGGALAGGF